MNVVKRLSIGKLMYHRYLSVETNCGVQKFSLIATQWPTKLQRIALSERVVVVAFKTARS